MTKSSELNVDQVLEALRKSLAAYKAFVPTTRSYQLAIEGLSK
jgi:hypothetical protein